MKTKSSLSWRRALLAIGGLLVGADFACGQNWTLTSAPITNWTSLASSADGHRLVAVVSGGGIYASTNSGVAWNLTSAPRTNWSAVASTADGRRLLAATFWGPVYVSTNYGVTWTDAGAPYYGWNVAASSADGNTLVISGRDSFGGSLFTSTNAGTSWIGPLGNAPLYSAATSGDGQKWVVVGYVGGHFGGGYLATSTNAGVTWTGNWDSGPYWRSVACSVDGMKWIGGALSSLYASPDFGATWIPSATPISGWWSSVTSSADGTRLVAVGEGQIIASTNSGTNWMQADAPNTNWSAIASSADGCRLVGALAGGGIYTWKTTPTPVLNITPSGSNLLISWTIPSLNFGLQQNTNLNTAEWVDVPITPTLNTSNLQNQVTLPATDGMIFYRLAAQLSD